MKKVIDKRKISLTLVLTLLLLLCATLFAGAKAVFANETVYFKGYGENLSYSDLYNATNTYGFNASVLTNVGEEKPWFSNNDWYDMSVRNDNPVNDSAMITVFTYGYRGGVSNWSTDENGDFAYDKQSIINQYAEYIFKSTGKIPEVYYAKMEGDEVDKSLYNFKLVRLNNDVNPDELYNANIYGQSVEYLGDLSKHTIILFDTRDHSSSNNRVYSELNYILSRILYNYRHMLNGVLPGINLIGHSRGGLINLQYTLDHPDIVKNVFSLDTPYADTTAGYIDVVKEYFKGGGVTDITDLETYSGYRKRWNENYDRLYSNVQIHALGGYSRISDATELLLSNLEDLLDRNEDSTLDVSYEQVKKGTDIVNFYFNYGNLFVLPLAVTGGLLITTPLGVPLLVLASAAPNNLINDTEAVLRRAYNIVVKHLPNHEEIESMVGDLNCLQYVIRDISYDNGIGIGSPFFYNDCTVDLNSQLGGVSAKEKTYEEEQKEAGQEITPAEDYKGFRKKIKQFTMSNITRDENGEIKTGSSLSPRVVHLLAPYDKEFVNYILDNVTFDGDTNNGKGWQYRSNANGTACITGYRGYFSGEVFEIPSSIDGKTVTEIGELAFSGKFAEGREISVIIPEGVTKIGYGAFNNCKTISEINFPSSLRVIDEGAFAGAFENNGEPVSISMPSGITKIGKRAFENTNITLVSLPNSLQIIGDEAFYGCNQLSGSITVGQNVKEIGCNAFGNCEKLINITVSNQNANYASEDGVLYTKNKNILVCYPSGKTVTNFMVDAACKELSNYAFSSNASLQTLDLNNVNIINSYAVINCPALATINAPETYFIYSAGIAATKLTNEAEDIVIGSVLYKKTSAGETVEIGDNIKSIAAYAFTGNDSVKKVVLGKNVESICEYAFTGCSSLETVEVLNLEKVVHLGTCALDGVSENLAIKVPRKYLGSYKTETIKGWTKWADKIAVLDKRSVKYVVNGNAVKESFVDYGDEIAEDYKYIDGDYYAKIWKTASGKVTNRYNIVTDDIVLYGELEPYVFTITYVTNGGEPITEGKYNVENDKELLEPVRAGYTFKGWYTSADFNEESKIGLIIEKGTKTGNLTIYAKWQANVYTVAFDTTVDEQVLPEEHVTFGESFVLGTPYCDGRYFNGWKDANGRMLTNSYGFSDFAWDIPNSTTVYADWTLIIYTIEYYENIQGRIWEVTSPENPSEFTVEDLPLRLGPALLRAAEHRGWYLDSNYTSEKITQIEELHDYVLYAKWAFLFIVDFNLNGGEFDNPEGYDVPYIAYSGDEFTLPTAKRNGYHGGYWIRNGIMYEFGASFKIPEDAYNDSFVFTVVWTPNRYTITFNFNGGRDGGSKATRTIQVVYGEMVPDIVLPVKTGYRFISYQKDTIDYYKQLDNGNIEKGIYRNTFDIEVRATWEIAYPKLSISGKSGGTWKIRIENTGSTLMNFEYNSKMLFEKDAKVWNLNDNDKKSVSIDSNASKTVDITENWFATCIVVSVKIDATRYITYAYNLNTNGTITCVNCTVSA